MASHQAQQDTANSTSSNTSNNGNSMAPLQMAMPPFSTGAIYSHGMPLPMPMMPMSLGSPADAAAAAEMMARFAHMRNSRVMMMPDEQHAAVLMKLSQQANGPGGGKLS